MISKRWSEFSNSFLGNPDGRHCHWCKHVITDFNAFCGHKDSPYYEERIRSLDGEVCPDDCGHFELNEWYENDENFYKSFPSAKQKLNGG